MAKRVSAVPGVRPAANDDGCALDGKSSPKRRRRREQDISAAQIDTFFAVLGDTCNVVRSAEAAGFDASWAYRKRRTDAAFRAGWAEAVREGYAKLELVLLERAMHGTAKMVTRSGGDAEIREYSTALAVALLRRHAATADDAGYEPGDAEIEAVRERLLDRLKRIKARDEADEFGGGEGAATDGACGDGAQG